MKALRKYFNLIVVIAIALAAVGGVVGVAGLTGTVNRAAAAANPAPQAIYQQYALLADTGITATDTGSAKFTGGNYASADCYSIVANLTAPQTVTVAIDHSADASNWVNLYSYTAVSTNGVAFTHTLVYGEYLRASATLAGSTAVTVTVRCVLKS